MNGKLAVLPEWWAVAQSPAGGVCQVLIQEHDLTEQLASSVRSPVALSHARGRKEAGEVLQQEHYEVKQGKTQCPAPRGITLCTSGGWEQPGGKQLCKEGSGCGGQQGDREPAAPYGSRGDEPHPGLHEQEHSQPSFAPCAPCWISSPAVQSCSAHPSMLHVCTIQQLLLCAWQFPFGFIRCSLCSVAILLSSSQGVTRRESSAAGCARSACRFLLHELSLGTELLNKLLNFPFPFWARLSQRLKQITTWLLSSAGDVQHLADSVRHIHNYRITEWAGLEGTTVGHLLQAPCSSRVMLEHVAQNGVQTVLEYLQ